MKTFSVLKTETIRVYDSSTAPKDWPTGRRIEGIEKMPKPAHPLKEKAMKWLAGKSFSGRSEAIEKVKEWATAAADKAGVTVPGDVTLSNWAIEAGAVTVKHREGGGRKAKAMPETPEERIARLESEQQAIADAIAKERESFKHESIAIATAKVEQAAKVNGVSVADVCKMISDAAKGKK